MMQVKGIAHNSYESDHERDIVDLSTAGSANRVPSVMGYKFLIGIKGFTQYHIGQRAGGAAEVRRGVGPVGPVPRHLRGGRRPRQREGRS